MSEKRKHRKSLSEPLAQSLIDELQEFAIGVNEEPKVRLPWPTACQNPRFMSQRLVPRMSF